MTDTVREATKQRIMKLLAKAEDQAVTEHEADAYRKKAYNLIASYGLDQAKLRAEFGAKEAHDELTTVLITLKGKYLVDQQMLLVAIAKPLNVSLVGSGKRQGISEVRAFGFESDIERVQMLYSSLWLQASGRLVKTPTPFGENRVRFAKSFLLHFAGVVKERLEAAEKQILANHQGTGLEVVLRDRSKNALDFMNQWIAEQGLRTRKSGVRRYNNGKEAGTAAGRTADIGQTKINGGRLQIGPGRS